MKALEKRLAEPDLTVQVKPSGHCNPHMTGQASTQAYRATANSTAYLPAGLVLDNQLEVRFDLGLGLSGVLLCHPAAPPARLSAEELTAQRHADRTG